ncbi:hypothetical protein CLOM_g11765 [Closterium sp. NIES-68]|nr:hypothetical protein CLOM_g11765 [Closterium sp. NIES-68]GJP76564.1 hypothetical protein CLOP_g6987 [Closterium sp. NIES-67]
MLSRHSLRVWLRPVAEAFRAQPSLIAFSGADGLRHGRKSPTGVGIPTAGATSRLYHKNVVDHYNHPRNVGAFDKRDPDVGTGLVGAPACGDVMKLQIKVDADGRIVDSCFKTFGCGSAIASSSLATEWVKGKHVDSVLEITNRDIAKHLSLPPVKLHCSMLAEDAIKAAVYDIKVKRERQEQ